jgi:Ca2+-binding EF-hand superfamily protein
MRVQVLIGILSLVAAGTAYSQGRDGLGAMFDRADGNGDGVVTRDEFLKSRADQFANRDRNSDGYIDTTDAGERAAARPRMRQAMSAIVAQLDGDKDGKVSQSEFVDGGAKLFERADTDASNSLDTDEIKAAKAGLRERATR